MPRHVRAIDDVDARQPLHGSDRFPAGNHEPQRIALVRTHRLPVLRVGDDRVVHRFGQRDAHRVLVVLVSLGHDPAGFLLDAALLEQHRQKDARPFAAAGSSVDQLNGLAVRAAQRTAVGIALEEMDARYRGHSLQLVERELEGTIHHTVQQQTMLLRIEIGDPLDVIHQKVKTGRRDDPVEILKRCHQRRVSERGRCAGRSADRVVERRRLPVREEIFRGRLGRGCLAAQRADAGHDQTDQADAAR